MSQWAYEMPNKALIGEFARACAQSGMSNSGLVIDPAGSMYAKEVLYFKGVLLSKLEGVKPPFKRGDVVKPKSGKDTYRVDLWRGRSRSQISRIYYEGDGRWLLEFGGISGSPRFDADEFVLESSVVVANK